MSSLAERHTSQGPSHSPALAQPWPRPAGQVSEQLITPSHAPALCGLLRARGSESERGQHHGVRNLGWPPRGAIAVSRASSEALLHYPMPRWKQLPKSGAPVEHSNLTPAFPPLHLSHEISLNSTYLGWDSPTNLKKLLRNLQKILPGRPTTRTSGISDLFPLAVCRPVPMMSNLKLKG